MVRLEELRGGGRSSSLLVTENVSSDNPSNKSMLISCKRGGAGREGQERGGAGRGERTDRETIHNELNNETQFILILHTPVPRKLG